MYATAGILNSAHRLGRRARARTTGRLTRTEMFIAVCALTATLCAALVPAIASRAASTTLTIAVRVASHDTLWDLAKAHPVEGSTTAETVSLIRGLNGMQGSVIAVGEVLRVPAPAAALTALARR